MLVSSYFQLRIVSFLTPETDDLCSACVALKLTKYEPRLDKLSASMEQQKSHCSKSCQMETLTFQ